MVERRRASSRNDGARQSDSFGAGSVPLALTDPSIAVAENARATILHFLTDFVIINIRHPNASVLHHHDAWAPISFANRGYCKELGGVVDHAYSYVRIALWIQLLELMSVRGAQPAYSWELSIPEVLSGLLHIRHLRPGAITSLTCGALAMGGGRGTFYSDPRLKPRPECSRLRR